MNKTIMDAIRAHALEESPRECCGFVIQTGRRQRYLPVPNTHENSMEYFRIDGEHWANAADAGTIIRVIHSHPGDGARAILSDRDRQQCNQSGVVWGIYAPDCDEYAEIVPDDIPLIGRPFTLQTEVQYSANGNGDNPLLLAGVPYPQHTYTQSGMKAGQEFWYRARLVDRIGNQSDWTDWVRGMASNSADDYLGDIAGGFLTSKDGDALTGQIDQNLEGQMQLALAQNATVEHQWAQYGEVRAEILVVKTTIADVDKAMAELSTTVQSEFGNMTATLEDKLTAVVDVDGASAIHTLKAGVRINGVYYGAGMSIAVVAETGQPVVTRIGFNANQLVLLSGEGDKQFSPFAVVDGQVFISEAFIQYGEFTLAKIGELRSSNYVEGKTGTIMKSDGTFEINGGVEGEGGMKITNATQSVKDENNVLRVQIGKITGVF